VGWVGLLRQILDLGWEKFLFNENKKKMEEWEKFLFNENKKKKKSQVRWGGGGGGKVLDDGTE
jgi:hypothetical protein